MKKESGPLFFEPKIGFGHLTSMAIIREVLLRRKIGHTVKLMASDLAPVFSQVALMLADHKYHKGAQSAANMEGYFQGRAKGHRWQMFLLGLDWKAELGGHRHIIATHAISARVAKMLGSKAKVDIVHIDHASHHQDYAFAPARKIFVPTSETKSWLLNNSSLGPEQVLAVGAMVHPLLLDREAEYRCQRLFELQNGALRIGMFLSGAAPRPHVEAILDAIWSLKSSSMLKNNVEQLVIFPGLLRRKMGKAIEEKLKEMGLSWERITKHQSIPKSKIAIIWTDSPEEAITMTHSFPKLNLVFSMANERVHWTSAGIPVVTLLPDVGPACVANSAFLKKAEVGMRLVYPEFAASQIENWMSLGIPQRIITSNQGLPDPWGAYKIADYISA